VSLEGPISKHSTTSHGTQGHSTTTHYLVVAGQSFEVGPNAYNTDPEAGFVRIYFLSRSQHVVNLEHLPDRPLPAGSTPRTVFHDFKQAIFSDDRAQLDEVRAEIAGTANALKAGISDDPVPPPTANRDQRPLAEAIQGTWSNGPVTVAFSGSGTFTITVLGANARSGHWSVNGNGKLVADLGGQSQATDAWIVGDQLTVSLGDKAFTLQRGSG
jgi:hypothetical protein